MTKKVEELLQTLKNETIEAITSDYENKEIKTRDIVKKYGLNISPNQLTELIPPLQTKKKCEWCSSFMLVKRKRSSYYPNYCSLWLTAHLSAQNVRMVENLV